MREWQGEFDNEWKIFLDRLLQELHYIASFSAVLSTLIGVNYQISAFTDIRVMFGQISLLSALFSLLFSLYYCMYLTGLKETDRGRSWYQNTQKVTFTCIKIPVLLAAPAAWLAWAVIFLQLSIFSYVWADPSESRPSVATRTAITVCGCLGFVHMIVNVLAFRHLLRRGSSTTVLTSRTNGTREAEQ